MARPISILGGGGLTLRAYEWGTPDGPPIMLLHGMSGSHLSFRSQIRTLTGARLIGVDLRGHGMSDKPDGGEFYSNGRLWASDLAAVLDHFGIENVTMVAWSYGALMLFDYLTVHGSSRIAAVNLVAGLTAIGTDRAKQGRTPSVAANLPAMLGQDLGANIAATRAFLRDWTREPLDAEEFETQLAANICVPATVRASLVARQADFSELISSLSMPLLVSHGQDDQIAPLSQAYAIAEINPRAHLSIYEGVGHMPFLERPDRFNQEILKLAMRTLQAYHPQ